MKIQPAVSRSLLCFFLACLLAGCTASSHIQNQITEPLVPVLDRAKAIGLYFTERNLSPIEGIWVWGNNQYEVAIVRNILGTAPEYQYLGLVTDSQQANWQRGEIKLLFKETASPGVFTGTYLMGNKSHHGTTFFLTNPNLIELYTPTGPFGSQQKLFLIRVYPKTATPEGKPTQGVATTGTGFFVSSEVVATNFHIVADARVIRLRIAGTQVNAEILLQDPQNDLVLLKLSPGSEPLVAATWKASAGCLILGDADIVKSGDRIYALGFPLSGVLGSGVNVSEGLINNTVGLQNDPRMFQVSVPIQPGSSGSPLFDSNGYVVGIVTSTLNNRFLFTTRGIIPQNVNFAVKASYLRSMLALVPGGNCPSSGRPTAISVTPRDLQARFSNAVVQVEVTR